MAIAQSTREALEGLVEALVVADAIGRAFDVAADEYNPPPWVYVYNQQLRCVSEASERLEKLLRQQVLPVLEDMPLVVRKS